MDWQPTNELRFKVKVIKVTPNIEHKIQRILQQRWVREVDADLSMRDGREYEWRDVPEVE